MPTRSGLLPLIVSIVLPAVVLGAGVYHLRQPPEVVSKAADFEQQLAKTKPDVIVFGSSLANRGVDLEVLGQEIGVAPRDMIIMQLPHSSLAHWYALLKNRVFANGYRPKLVLVVGAMTTMLNHDLLAMQPNVERLVQQLTPYEPVIAKQVFRFDDPEQFRQHYARERASRYRQGFLDGVRDQLLKAAFTPRGKLGEAQRLAERVNEEVFATERMDYGLHNNHATGVGASEAPLLVDDSIPFELRRDALLGAFQELADAHGTHVVYVRYPFPPSNRDMDEVPPEIAADAVSWMEELGAGYLDMRALDLDDTQYEDMRHMTRQGAHVFSAAIGRALVAMDALGSGEGVRVIRGVAKPSTVTVGGRVPALPDLSSLTLDEDCRAWVDAGPLSDFDDAMLRGLGRPHPPFTVSVGGRDLQPRAPADGCVGGYWVEDGRLVISPAQPELGEAEVRWTWEVAGLGETKMRWVIPGTGHTFRFDEAWSLPKNTFRVYARGLRGGDEGTARVRVEDGYFELHGQDGRLAAVARPRPPKQPAWELEVSVEEGDAPFLLHHLAVGVAPTTTYLLGSAETLHGSSVRVVGGRVDDVRHEPTFAAAPIELPNQPRLRRGKKGTGVFGMTAMEDLADSADKTSSRPNRCSPVRVLEDGVELTLPHTTCLETQRKLEGRSCFAEDRLMFGASDGTDPLTNMRDYRLGLTPSRLCETFTQRGAATLRGSWWLYPDDVATFEVPARRTADFLDGVNQVEIEVIPHVSGMNRPLEVRFFQGDELLVEDTWAPDGTMRRREHHMDVWPPRDPRTGGFRVELANPSKSFVLVTLVSVGEGYDLFSVDNEVSILSVGEAREKLPVRDVMPSARRVGTTPDLEEPKKIGPAKLGAYEARAWPLWPVSTTVLEREGRGQATPVRMKADGQVLIPRVTKRGLRAGCDACFLHTGQALMYKAPNPETAALEVYLDPRFPFMSPDGGVAWWVYPRTQGVFDQAEPWQGEELRVVAHIHAFHPKRAERGKSIALRVGEHSVAFEPVGSHGAMRAELVVSEASDGPWSIEVDVDADEGFAMIDRLRYTDASGEEVAILPRTVEELGLEEATP